MKTIAIVSACAVLVVLAAYAAAGCGTTSPCQDLSYKMCDCWFTDKAEKDSCYEEVDKSSYSAEMDSECAKYKDTCTCDAAKNAEQSKTACGGIDFAGT